MQSVVVRTTVALAVLTIFTVPASAAPILWTLSGAFNDGGTASGSFVYDADLNLYSDVDVTTTAGSARSGSTYSFVSPGIAPSNTQVLFNTVGGGDLTGTPGFALFFSVPLTNTGGIVPLLGGQEATCSDPTCLFPSPPNRFLTGSVSGTAVPVPEPASLLMLGTGLSLLRLSRARRRR